MSAKGEYYASKKAMMKHEKNEGPAARLKEYGSKTGGMKKTSAKKATPKKMGKKK